MTACIETVGAVDARERLDIDGGSLLHAIQKEFSHQGDNYLKGKAFNLIALLKEDARYSGRIILSIGRVGAGSRLDAQLECAMAIFVNIPEYLHYHNLFDCGHHTISTILDKSVYIRLKMVSFQAAFRSRSIWWHSVFQPLRVLTNGTDLGIEILDMGPVFDCVEQFAIEIRDNHEARLAFIQGTKVCFDVSKFPVLTEFYSKRRSCTQVPISGNKSQRVNINDYVTSRLFDCSDEALNFKFGSVFCTRNSWTIVT